MTVSTSSSLNSLFADIYERALFVARENNLMTQLVTNYSGSGLQQRFLGIRPEATAQEVAEGTDYSNAIEFTKTNKMTLTPKIVKAQTIITQSQIDTDPDDTMMDASEELGAAIATKIDEDILGLFSSFTAGKGSAGNSLTIAICAAGMAKLTSEKARGPHYFVLHPFGWYDVWTELGQPAAEKALLGDVANEALRGYFVGTFLSAQWYVSANIAIDGSTDAVGAVFNREALAFDVRKAAEMLVDEDPSIAGRGYEIDMEAIYAVGVRRNEFGVKLTHDATEPTG